MSEPDMVDDRFQWSIVELLGHRRVAGLVSEVERFGTKMLRVDIPGPSDGFVATQFYSGSALYCVTPTTQSMARRIAELGLREPVTRWELPARQDDHPLPESCADCGLDPAVCGCNGDDSDEDP